MSENRIIKNITIKFDGDNADFIAALDEVERKIDLITEKMKNLIKLSSRLSEDVRKDFQENL